MDAIEIAEKFRKQQENMDRMLERSEENLIAMGEERTTEWIVDVLESQIKELEESLPDNKTVCLLIPGYGRIKTTDILSDGAETLVIKGRLENSGQVTIVQNISQVNVGLVVAEISTNEEKKRIKIGFLK